MRKKVLAETFKFRANVQSKAFTQNFCYFRLNSKRTRDFLRWNCQTLASQKWNRRRRTYLLSLQKQKSKNQRNLKLKALFQNGLLWIMMMSQRHFHSNRPPPPPSSSNFILSMTRSHPPTIRLIQKNQNFSFLDDGSQDFSLAHTFLQILKF